MYLLIVGLKTFIEEIALYCAKCFVINKTLRPRELHVCNLWLRLWKLMCCKGSKCRRSFKAFCSANASTQSDFTCPSRNCKVISSLTLNLNEVVLDSRVSSSYSLLVWHFVVKSRDIIATNANHHNLSEAVGTVRCEVSIRKSLVALQHMCYEVLLKGAAKFHHETICIHENRKDLRILCFFRGNVCNHTGMVCGFENSGFSCFMGRAGRHLLTCKGFPARSHLSNFLFFCRLFHRTETVVHCRDNSTLSLEFGLLTLGN